MKQWTQLTEAKTHFLTDSVELVDTRQAIDHTAKTENKGTAFIIGNSNVAIDLFKITSIQWFIQLQLFPLIILDFKIYISD